MVRFTRRVYDGQNLPKATIKTFHLVVRAGAVPGQRITYEGWGDESPDTEPGDVIFVTRDAVHDVRPALADA
jgi:DnaJ-class molecular chaperone